MIQTAEVTHLQKEKELFPELYQQFWPKRIKRNNFYEIVLFLERFYFKRLSFEI